MQIGDTIHINSNWTEYFKNGNYTLDSIGDVTIAQGVRKVYYLNCHICSGSNTLSWIESVGNIGSTIYPYSHIYEISGTFSACPGFQHNLGLFITSFQHGQKVYYDSCSYQQALYDNCFAILDTCEYYNTCGSVSEIPSFSSIVLSPNPFHTSTIFTIKDKQFTKEELKIYDDLGRMVVQKIIKNQETELGRNSLNNGIYFFQIIGNGKMSTGEFIIE